MHKTLLGAALAAALMGFGAAAQAQSIVVNIAPPAPRYEVVPAARAGYVWAKGHYAWRGNQYVWVPGHWVTARAGYIYRDPQWVQRANGTWFMVGNNWERGAYGDRDGDGRRNGRDPHPNIAEQDLKPWGDMDRDGIANRNDRDIDGDRVANNRDRFPYDARRR